MLTTQKAVRAAFWEALQYHRELADYKRKSGYTQNQYPDDVRMAFCDFVDMLERNGDIGETLAQRVTL